MADQVRVGSDLLPAAAAEHLVEEVLPQGQAERDAPGSQVHVLDKGRPGVLHLKAADHAVDVADVRKVLSALLHGRKDRLGQVLVLGQGLDPRWAGPR